MNRLTVAAVLCFALLAGAWADSVVYNPATPKAGDALFKMRAADDGEVVKNVFIPITPGAAMGWSADGTPAALPMPTPFFFPFGTPTASTPGTEGQPMFDDNYIYIFHAGSWKKSARTNL